MTRTRGAAILDRWRRRTGTYYRDPRAYWDARHRVHGDALSGAGCVCLDEGANELDYDTKWAQLAPVLDREVRRGARSILDAGCGPGWFTRHLHELGFERIEACDFSVVAAARAQQLAPTARVWVSALEDARADIPYDVVMCIDVLFHLVDDATWARSVANIASMVEPGGAIVLQDSRAVPGQERPAPHVRLRGIDHYQAVFEPATWRLESCEQYALTAEAVTKLLMVFRRLPD